MRLCGASLTKSVRGEGFRTFASKGQNGFVGGRIVSSPTSGTTQSGRGRSIKNAALRPEKVSDERYRCCGGGFCSGVAAPAGRGRPGRILAGRPL
jgi:hypothetical protein